MSRILSIAALICCCATILLIMTSCLGRTTLQSEQVSPTGAYKADLSEADTGAAGGWMSSVRILEADPSLWTRWLGRDGETVLGGDLRSTQVTLWWQSATHLEIRCTGCEASKVQVQKNTWKDVTISYRMDRQEK